jgi:anti-sigma factor RsiW
MTERLDAGCRNVLARISGYLDGELDAPSCDVIERHCAGCPSCASVVQGLRETVGLCRQAGSLPLPEQVRDRARARVRALLDANDQ